VWAETGREADFLDRFVHADIGNHYDSNGSGSLFAIEQDNSSCLKVIEI
jgi:hypothetical protein